MAQPLKEDILQIPHRSLSYIGQEGWKMIIGQQGAQMKIKFALLKRKKNTDTE